MYYNFQKKLCRFTHIYSTTSVMAAIVNITNTIKKRTVSATRLTISYKSLETPEALDREISARSYTRRKKKLREKTNRQKKIKFHEKQRKNETENEKKKAESTREP